MEAAVQAAGCWVFGRKCFMSSVIRKSVTCRKLRGRRLEDGINVGLDVFKSWTIINVHVLQEVGVQTACTGQYSLPGCQPELCTSS